MTAIQFTVLMRFPFSRGDFVDPPQASWDAEKDRSLWKTISKSPKTSDLKWVELAAFYHVPPAFLLQQAAWLYERHLDHVRAQMKKVSGTNAPGAFSLGSTHATMSVPMKRAGSGGSGASRTPSGLSARPRDSPVPQGETSTPAPPLSRTPSTNTITQSRAYPQPPTRIQQPRHKHVGPKLSDPTTHDVQSSDDRHQTFEVGSPTAAESPSDNSSLSDSDTDSLANRSQLFKRPPRFRNQRPRELLNYDDDIDEGEEPLPDAAPLLPFANAKAEVNKRDTFHVAQILTAARGKQPEAGRSIESSEQAKEQTVFPSGGSASMKSSTSDAPKGVSPSAGPLSPNHRAELAKLSPRKSGLKSRKEGSEGTPSMGSSFSDIDDASISQSALEEALLSNIQHGRMSTLSQLRSRYL